MKKIFKRLIGAVICSALCCSLCSSTFFPRKKPVSVVRPVEIVDCYINALGRKVFVMSDGGMAEIVIYDENYIDHIQFYDKNYRELMHASRGDCFTKWMNAEVGGSAALKQEDSEHQFYDVIILPNKTIERKVIRITKYDGNLNKIDGKIKISGSFLSGTSGSGRISGKGMGSEKMFINIYFADRDPITVNAMENQLWLDVEVGDTVVEKRINGRTTFVPKF